eukprot:3934252-Pleurochrysis_carterae.AAC.7
MFTQLQTSPSRRIKASIVLARGRCLPRTAHSHEDGPFERPEECPFCEGKVEKVVGDEQQSKIA